MVVDLVPIKSLPNISKGSMPIKKKFVKPFLKTWCIVYICSPGLYIRSGIVRYCWKHCAPLNSRTWFWPYSKPIIMPILSLLQYISICVIPYIFRSKLSPGQFCIWYDSVSGHVYWRGWKWRWGWWLCEDSQFNDGSMIYHDKFPLARTSWI